MDRIMDKLPQYASELIIELDKVIPVVEFPLTLEGIEDLSERKVRRMAFAAGQRALIDDLLLMVKEDDDGDRDSVGNWDAGSSSGYGSVFIDGEFGSEQD
jgi:hypothetical protein